MAQAAVMAKARRVRRNALPAPDAVLPAREALLRVRVISGTATQDESAEFQTLQYDLFKMISLSCTQKDQEEQRCAWYGARVKNQPGR